MINRELSIFNLKKILLRPFFYDLNFEYII